MTEKHFDPKQRAAEKSESRQKDMDDLAAGRITRADLAKRNNFTASLDLKNARIVNHPIPKI